MCDYINLFVETKQGLFANILMTNKTKIANMLLV